MAAKTGKPERKRSHRPEAPKRSADARRPSHRPSTARAKLDTMGYEERPREPRSGRAPQGSSPELITIEETPIGRATHHAIEQELSDLSEEALGDVAAPVSAVAPVPVQAEIFEISTFVVTGDEIYGKASEASRRAFVAERVLHRLPVVSMEDVVRIDLSRSPTPHTVIMRVWTKLSRPSR